MPIATHEIVLDMQVELRKPHACGGATWQVVRVGVDIGLRCLQCQHRVTLPATSLCAKCAAWSQHRRQESQRNRV